MFQSLTDGKFTWLFTQLFTLPEERRQKENTERPVCLQNGDSWCSTIKWGNTDFPLGKSTLEAYRKLLSIPLLAEWTPLGLGSYWNFAGDDCVIWLSPVLVKPGGSGTSKLHL